MHLWVAFYRTWWRQSIRLANNLNTLGCNTYISYPPKKLFLEKCVSATAEVFVRHTQSHCTFFNSKYQPVCVGKTCMHRCCVQTSSLWSFKPQFFFSPQNDILKSAHPLYYIKNSIFAVCDFVVVVLFFLIYILSSAESKRDEQKTNCGSFAPCLDLALLTSPMSILPLQSSPHSLQCMCSSSPPSQLHFPLALSLLPLVTLIITCKNET